MKIDKWYDQSGPLKIPTKILLIETLEKQSLGKQEEFTLIEVEEKEHAKVILNGNY